MLLVGGASRRFGSPKALARLDGETLADRAWRTLGEACDERLAVGKASDRLELPFALVDDETVVAGLRAAKHDLCVFVPVDCPFVSPKSLRKLAERAPAHPQTGPLPGAYPRSLLSKLERKLERGDYSLRELEASVVELDERELANVNTQTDLLRVQML